MAAIAINRIVKILTSLADRTERRFRNLSSLERMLILAITSLGSLAIGILGSFLNSALQKATMWASGGISVLLLALVLALAVTHFHSSAEPKQLPDITKFRLLRHELYWHGTPAMDADVDALIQEVFGSAKIDAERMQQIRRRNNLRTVKLYQYDQSGDNATLVGFASCFPVKKDYHDRFLAGRTEEQHISADDMLSTEARHSARYLYIPTMCVRDARSRHGMYRTIVLHIGLLGFIREVYGGVNHEITIFLAAASNSGRAIAQNLYEFAPHGHVAQYDRMTTIYQKTIPAGQLSSYCSRMKEKVIADFFNFHVPSGTL